jgi:hypothetical protein
VLVGGPGPFLLARLHVLFPSARHAGILVAAVGAGVVLVAAWAALAHDGARRWLVFAGGAPPGFALLALGLDGTWPAIEVMALGCVASSAAHLGLGSRGEDEDAIDAAKSRPTEHPLLVGLPARLGGLLASMERWVVEAVAGAIAVGARVASWIVARVDDHIVTSPADVAASGLERAVGAVEPLAGAPPSRVTWALLGLAGVAALLHAVWPGG